MTVVHGWIPPPYVVSLTHRIPSLSLQLRRHFKAISFSCGSPVDLSLNLLNVTPCDSNKAHPDLSLDDPIHCSTRRSFPIPRIAKATRK